MIKTTTIKSIANSSTNSTTKLSLIAEKTTTGEDTLKREYPNAAITWPLPHCESFKCSRSYRKNSFRSERRFCTTRTALQLACPTIRKNITNLVRHCMPFSLFINNFFFPEFSTIRCRPRKNVNQSRELFCENFDSISYIHTHSHLPTHSFLFRFDMPPKVESLFWSSQHNSHIFSDRVIDPGWFLLIHFLIDRILSIFHLANNERNQWKLKTPQRKHKENVYSF